MSVGHGGLGAFAKTAFLFQPNQRVCWLPLLSGFSSCVERARFGEHCWAGSENSSWALGTAGQLHGRAAGDAGQGDAVGWYPTRPLEAGHHS